MKDYTLIALAYQGEARIYVALSTKLAEKSRKLHQTKPTATAAMGRFLTASAMMSLMYKDNERLTLKIDGDGPIGQMTVLAKNGIVKSTIKNPDVYLVYNDGPKKGKLNVGAAVGHGFLYVTKDWKGHFFTSSAPLQTGEIAEDFTYFYTASEQTPSAVGLGVLVLNGSKVLHAGGFIVQLLPHASENTIKSLETAISQMPSITDLLKDNHKPEAILSKLASNTENILETHEIKYVCSCRKTTYRKSLKGLNIEILNEILDEDKQAEIICPYCNKKYLFTEDELKSIISSKTKSKK